MKSGSRSLWPRRGAVVLALALASAAVGAQQRYWYDGQVRRPLWVDASRTADFSGGAADLASVVKPGPTVKETSSTSPVFRDAADANTAPRALPGGVIVELPAGLDDAARAALFARHGLTPVRRIGDDPRRWLVATPAGLPSLDTANRLFESGDFVSASPNWWRPRERK
jgi:hypothetical protein